MNRPRKPHYVQVAIGSSAPLNRIKAVYGDQTEDALAALERLGKAGWLPWQLTVLARLKHDWLRTPTSQDASAPRRTLKSLASAGRFSIHLDIGTYDDTDEYDPNAVAQQLREAADILEETP